MSSSRTNNQTSSLRRRMAALFTGSRPTSNEHADNNGVTSQHEHQELDGDPSREPQKNEMFSAARYVGISGGTMINAEMVTIHHGPTQLIANEQQFPPTDSPSTVQHQHQQVSSDISSSRTSQRSCHVYWRNLIVKGRGSPLWCPEPNTMPEAHQQTGVSIGDVGLLLPSGGFHFFFNICYPGDHPINSGGVPEGFVPLDPPINPLNIEKRSVKPSNSWYASKNVHVSCERTNADLVFESVAEEGAILTLPHGSSSEDLYATRGLKKYIGKHILSWYKYISIDREFEIENGDVRLVTGWDKTSRWGVAAFANSSESVRLRFQPPDGMVRSYSWQYSGSLDSRSGPDEDTNIQTDSALTQTVNQCVFVRTLNASFDANFWNTLINNSFVKISNHSNSLQFLNDEYMPPMSSISSHQVSNNGVHYGGGQPSPNQLSVDFSRAMMPNPSKTINDFLWRSVANRKSIDTRIMVTHDDDWISLLKYNDHTLPEPSELFRRMEGLRPTVVEEDDILTLNRPNPLLLLFELPNLVQISDFENHGKADNSAQSTVKFSGMGMSSRARNDTQKQEFGSSTDQPNQASFPLRCPSDSSYSSVTTDSTSISHLETLLSRSYVHDVLAPHANSLNKTSDIDRLFSYDAPHYSPGLGPTPDDGIGEQYWDD